MNLLYRFEGDLTETIPIGLVPEGVRLDVAFTAQLVDGPLAGAELRGIDYLLLRSDGVGVIDAYEVVTGKSGTHISAHAQGYIVPPEGMQLPPPNVLLSPDFRWPDIPLPLHGFVMYRTGDGALAWLNRTAAAFEGSVNVGTRRIEVTARSLVGTPAS